MNTIVYTICENLKLRSVLVIFGLTLNLSIAYISDTWSHSSLSYICLQLKDSEIFNSNDILSMNINVHYILVTHLSIGSA